MATKIRVIKTTFQVRRGLASNWKSINPVLRPGEPGYELDTYRLKIGDGEKAYNDLPYIGGTGTSATVSVDGKSIIMKDDGSLAIAGFDEGKEGQVLTKGPNGTIVWGDACDCEAMTSEDILNAIFG